MAEDRKKKGRSTSPLKDLPAEHWQDAPQDHDFPAAANYLSLLVDSEITAVLVERLRGADITRRKAKDLLRASRLALLPPDNAHVAADLEKVRSGARLSPVLLVRGELGRDVALVVVDGYHRICASYHIDENAQIPCKLVDFPV